MLIFLTRFIYINELVTTP